MTLRQLQYLVAVVDEGSFARAAPALYVSQPTLSQQVRTLEAEIGGPLLERLPRGVRPTPAGEAFLPAARAALAATERARHSARMVLELEAGELEIATVGTVALGLLPPVLRRWRARHRGLIVRVHEHRDAPTLAQAVSEGNADMGIGPRPREWSGPLEALGWEKFVVILPPGDPLRRGAAPVALAALADREWVLFEREHALGQLVERLCRQRASHRARQCGAPRSPASPRSRPPGSAPRSCQPTSFPRRLGARSGPSTRHAPANCARSPAPSGRLWRAPSST
jgi:DNA-binding transcriptional LysR family regulator